MTRRKLRLILVVTIAFGLLVAGPIGVAGAQELPPGGSFQDDNGIEAEGWIEAIAAVGVTQGCAEGLFCPDVNLNRGQMATFLVRAFDIPASSTNHFNDDNGSVHEPAINAMASAGITDGCTETAFCTYERVTRAQLATFLARVLELEPVATPAFPDDGPTRHDGNIAALVAAGIVEGCSDTSYCPTGSVPRWLMATNLAKALGLDPIIPPPPPFPPHPDVGDGKRIIYANAAQRVWLIDENNVVVDSYLVSGREGSPSPGTYSVFSKSENAYAYNGITMDWMVRFAWGVRLAIGFHGIPRYADGTPMQTLDQLGTFQSHGCVRQDDVKAEALFHWAEIGTTVHVTP